MVATEPTSLHTPAPPPSRRVSILPAAAVLLVAIGMLVIFGLMNMIGSSSTTPTTVPVILGGLPFSASASAAAFQGWVSAGEPPSNVASGLIVPRGAVRVGTVYTGGGGAGGDYDLENRLTVDAPRARVLGFYRSHLQALGWDLFSKVGTAGGGAALLFEKAGADGFYWEAGVTATSVTPSRTSYTYRLFQVTDVD